MAAITGKPTTCHTITLAADVDAKHITSSAHRCVCVLLLTQRNISTPPPMRLDRRIHERDGQTISHSHSPHARLRGACIYISTQVLSMRKADAFWQRDSVSLAQRVDGMLLGGAKTVCFCRIEIEPIHTIKHTTMTLAYPIFSA